MKIKSLKYHTKESSSESMQSTPVTALAPINMFEARIKSPATRATYRQATRQFSAQTGFALAEKVTDQQVLERVLSEYIVRLRDAGSSFGRLNVIISALRE